jgi:hypothetical protein
MTAKSVMNRIGAPFFGSTGMNPALSRGDQAFPDISG